MAQKYTVHYMLLQDEKEIFALNQVLTDKVKRCDTFDEAITFIRDLRGDKRLVGKPTLHV
jgi:hypothetical protein